MLIKEPHVNINLDEIKFQFSAFIEKYKKIYTSVEEMESRFKVFSDNFSAAVDHNKNNKNTFKLGINKFSDMTFDEFKASFLQPINIRNKTVELGVEVEENNENKKNDYIRNTDYIERDWRRYDGAVTPVKNQQRCGSCWSFSTTGVLEGYFAIKKGIKTSFSEQQLVDCSRNYGNYGCNGGLVDMALLYVKDNGIATEENYPYEAIDNMCKSVNSDKYKIKGYTEYKFKDYYDLASALNEHPISVYYEVTEKMMRYSSGIFEGDENCLLKMNHAMLLIGFKIKENNYKDDNSSYVIVKNSWSEGWGEEGYIRFAANNINKRCGILYRSYGVKE